MRIPVAGVAQDTVRAMVTVERRVIRIRQVIATVVALFDLCTDIFLSKIAVIHIRVHSDRRIFQRPEALIVMIRDHIHIVTGSAHQLVEAARTVHSICDTLHKGVVVVLVVRESNSR